MTLINPFGVSRYLHPRHAGLIVYKGGGASTTITGLGDDQFSTLQTGQGNIRSDITAQGDAAQTYADTVTAGQENITNLIGTGSTGEGSSGTGLYGQFSNQANLLSGLGERIGTGFSDLTGTINTETANLAEGQSGLMTGQSGIVTGLEGLQAGQDTGFTNIGTRFDTVDQANVNMQTAVDEGFQDQAQGFTDANANMSAGFADSATALNEGFSDAGAALNTGFSDTESQLTDTQANVLAGQQGLDSSLTTLSDAADMYAAQSLENQEGLLSGQDAFVSNFDTYVDRYSDDVSLANQFRTDLEEAQTNAFSALREDQLNQFNSLGQNISDFSNTNQSNVDQLNQAVSSGFSGTSTEQQISNQNQTNDLNSIRGLLQTTGQSLDATTRDQYQKLTNAFDQQGNLITQGIDDQGNTVRRQLDAQGAVIETRFNQSGNQIGQFRMDVGQMIATANNFVSGQISNVGADTQARFDVQTGTLNAQGKSLLTLASQNTSLDQTVRNEFMNVASAFDNTGALIGQSANDLGTLQRQIDQNGNLITTRFDQTGGLIDQSSSNIAKSIADASNAIQSGQTGLSTNINALGTTLDQTSSGLMAESGDLRSQIRAGFNANNQTMNAQVRDMARVASSIQDLDISRRQDLSELSEAFDDQGQLIRSTVAENGVTTARAIDQNGNLMLRAFDATGNELGNKVVDINQQLNFLGEYRFLPGANTSMGNLSPAVQTNNSGFMSPFTQTR